MATVLIKIKTRVEKFIDWIAVFFFSVIGIVAMLQIIMRYVFNRPFVWSEEFLRLTFVWTCYIGWIIATRNKCHIRITVILSLLPSKGKKIMETFNNILTIGFSVFMIFFGKKLIELGRNTPAMTLPITFALVYSIVPITCLIILIYHVLDIVELWKKPQDEGIVL